MASASSSIVPRGVTVRVARQKKASVGEFRIAGRPLGRGGSATVYRVTATDGTESAVKELAPQFLGDKEAVARFRREFDIARELDHPGIVRAHELIEANGTLNIRMQFIDGASLRALIAKHKRLEPELACWVALQAAKALAHAHAREIIHRDVKPDNILVDSRGRVKVGDFGTARLANLALTRAGTLLGTPVYMAPELLSGKKDAAPSPASDVYSLGAVLYEAIEGRAPFAAGRKGELLPLLYAKSFQKPREMTRAADPELARLVERCLAREPAHRPRDMDEMCGLLGRFAMPAGSGALAELVAESRKRRKAGKSDGRGPRSERSAIRSLPGVRPPGKGIQLHDTRFGIAFFAVVATLILYLLTLSPAGRGAVRSGAPVAREASP